MRTKNTISEKIKILNQIMSPSLLTEDSMEFLKSYGYTPEFIDKYLEKEELHSVEDAQKKMEEVKKDYKEHIKGLNIYIGYQWDKIHESKEMEEIELYQKIIRSYKKDLVIRMDYYETKISELKS